jgi:hypothetical protein
VDGADDGPLGAHFFEAAQQELAETAGLFDLSEHRLGQLLAQPVRARVPAGLDLRAHCLDARRGESCAALASPVTGPATASLARPVAT